MGGQVVLKLGKGGSGTSCTVQRSIRQCRESVHRRFRTSEALGQSPKHSRISGPGAVRRNTVYSRCKTEQCAHAIALLALFTRRQPPPHKKITSPNNNSRKIKASCGCIKHPWASGPFTEHKHRLRGVACRNEPPHENMKLHDYQQQHQRQYCIQKRARSMPVPLTETRTSRRREVLA